VSLRSLLDVPAPAKLNLFLHVIGRRADGYHLIQSAFTLIDWADTLHFERRDDGRLQRHDLTDTLPADDLCLRAARALQAASGCTRGADISIQKRVPSGAGLGGGSSDAASTLLALNRLWGLGWPAPRLRSLGAELGADVPFFVSGAGAALVEGIGERLTPIALPACVYAVIKPAASLATAQVFGHPALVREGAAAILSGFLADATTPGTGSRGSPLWGRNDLQPVAEALEPEVAHAARWLAERYGTSRMTGSGSAVFARVGIDAAPMAIGALEDLPAGWVGRSCRSLASHPLAAWAD
jgi:4-diphosphocytidyl-2-C-methyl-D-erythritol kinase